MLEGRSKLEQHENLIEDRWQSERIVDTRPVTGLSPAEGHCMQWLGKKVCFNAQTVHCCGAIKQWIIRSKPLQDKGVVGCGSCKSLNT